MFWSKRTTCTTLYPTICPSMYKVLIICAASYRGQRTLCLQESSHPSFQTRPDQKGSISWTLKGQFGFVTIQAESISVPKLTIRNHIPDEYGYFNCTKIMVTLGDILSLYSKKVLYFKRQSSSLFPPFNLATHKSPFTSIFQQNISNKSFKDLCAKHFCSHSLLVNS